MKAISILVASNSEKDIAVLANQINSLPFLSLCKFVFSFDELITNVKNEFPDILIVDTDNISLSSFKALYCFVQREALPMIVISNTPSHAIDAFDTGIPIDFILKPIKFPRIEIAIRRAMLCGLPKSIIDKQDHIFLKIGRVYKKFLFDDIIYVEGYGIYSKIMTPRGKITINDSLMNLESKLNKKVFKRVQKSFIINISKIVALKAGSLEMEIGEVSIGTRYKSSIERILDIIKNDNVYDTELEMH